MSKKYLVVLSNSDKFEILNRINQFSGAMVEEKNTFGGEIALLITVFKDEEEFLRIIKGATRVVGKDFKDQDNTEIKKLI
jgi:hypothetical protein